MTEQHAAQLVSLLIQSGSGAGGRQAVAQLDEAKTQPTFIQLLCHCFGAPQCPPTVLGLLPPQHQQTPWGFVRAQSGLALKNAITKDVPEPTLKVAAESAVTVISQESERVIVNAAAMVIARVTAITGVQWWTQQGVDLAGLLLNQMLPDPARAPRALQCLQFLCEDAAHQMGETTGNIIQAVANVAQTNQDPSLRRRALVMIYNTFEFGSELDWRHETLSATQQGLCTAAPHAASCATAIAQAAAGQQDNQALITCLRLFCQLVDYFAWIGTSPQLHSLGGLAGCAGVWAQAASHAIALANDSPETATAGCEYVGAITNCWLQSAGDKPSVNGAVEHVGQQANAIIAGLLQCMVMRPDEEHDIMATDDYRHRDPEARRRGRTRRQDADAEAAGVEDDQAKVAASLRDAACQALSTLLAYQPESFPTAWALIGPSCAAGVDWHITEAGFVAIGVCYEGCSPSMRPFLEQVTDHLCGVIATGVDTTKQHVILTSAALGAAAEILDWAVLSSLPRFQALTRAGIACMPSASKRLQLAATSLVKRAIMLAISADSFTANALGQELLASISQTMYQCLPVYHTRNLSVLCDLAIKLFTMVPAAHIGSTVQPFHEDIARRIEAMKQQVTQHVQSGDVSAVAEKDAFQVGRVPLAAALVHSTPETVGWCLQSLQQWMGLAQSFCQMDVQKYDTELIYWTLFLSCNSVNGIDTPSLAPHAPALGQLALQCLSIDDTELRSTCCTIIFELLNRVGATALPGGNPDALVEKIVPFADLAQFGTAAADGCLAVMALVALGPQAATANVQRLVSILASQVRGDTWDNPVMTSFAECLGAMMKSQPAWFTTAQIGTVAQALTPGPVTEYKGDATVGICYSIQNIFGLLAAGQLPADQQQTLLPMFQAFVRLVYSFQAQAASTPNLPQLINQILQQGGQAPGVSSWLHQEMQELTTNKNPMREVIRQMYGV